MKISALFFLLSLFTASFAFGFIPTSKTILIRTAKAHGKGAYIIEQDVTLKVEGEPITVRETWTVVNAETMRVSVSRRGSTDNPVRLDIVYRGGKRTFLDSTGTAKSINISSEFIEPYFFYRTSNSLQSSLQKARIIPADFGKVPRQIVSPNPKNIKNPKEKDDAPLISINEPYVRLSRTAGVVNWAFGKVDGDTGPGIWIEQDAFVIRKIKFPTAAEVQADQYQAFSGQLKFPRERTIKWGNYSATARVISVRAATDAETNRNLSLGAGGEDNASKVPEVAGLKEFYSRFR